MNGWQATVRARLGDFLLDVELSGDDGVLALVGENGSGKSSLLRALLGAIDVEHIELSVGAELLASSARGVARPIEARRLGYVPQGNGLLPHIDVLDNVAFGLSTGPRRLPRAQRRQRARALLSRLDCASLCDRRVAGLSGGEQQRVALARALLLEPRMLLLDEPLSALDAINRRRVRAFLAEHLSAFGGPTLLVTHDARDIEALGARVCALDSGRVVQTGTLQALRAAPGSAFIAELVAAR
jgi:ABC-type sulfate/molybdate transport systems ATPase subunit